MRWLSRRRMRQAVLVLLALVLLLVLAVAIFVWCGGPQALLIARYQERLPGELSIAELKLPGLGRYHLQWVRIRDAGAELLCNGRVEVATSGLSTLKSLHIADVELRAEALTREFLDRSLTALAALAREPGLPAPFRLTVAGLVGPAVRPHRPATGAAGDGERVPARLSALDRRRQLPAADRLARGVRCAG